MRRRLYLHIGHPKCASTTIQSALARNVAALREHGFLVADGGLDFPESGPLGSSPTHEVAALIERGEPGLLEAVQRVDRASQRSGERFGRLVLSAESLTIPGAELFAKALRHVFEIHVLYYVRRQDDYLVSAWNQWGCKEGVGLAPYVERELAVPQPNFPRVLERWRPHADSLRVRPLHPAALTGGHVVTDLFDAILKSEEEHVDWLETQLGLIEKVGLENYQQSQT